MMRHLPLLLPALLVAALPLRADEQPTLKVSAMLHSDGTRTETTTNLEANTSEEKKLDAKGQQISRILFELDEQKTPMSGTVFNAKDQPVYRFEYERDPFGKITEERKFTPAGAFAQRLVYHYNPQGRVSRVEAFDAQGNPIGTTQKTAPAKPSQRKSDRRTR